MSNSAPVATTNVVGYFNSKKFPLYLFISRLGITIEVRSGEYVKDARGRKFNDPLFEGYPQLSKETSPTPVPVYAVPEPKPIQAPSDGHSVHSVNEFKYNEHGFRQPVMPTPKPHPTPTAINVPQVRGMSMDEARRLRLVRPVREVPEDYGVADTDAAMPPRGPDIPMIREARDMPVKQSATTPVPAAPPVAAPAEVPEPAVPVPAVNAEESPERAALQASLLEQHENAEALVEDPNVFLNRVVQPVAPAVARQTSAQVNAEVPEDAALPLPTLDEVEEQAPEPVAAPAPPKPKAQPLPPRRKFICAADGRSFDFRSQLEQHVDRKFPHLKEQLMAPYPKT